MKNKITRLICTMIAAVLLIGSVPAVASAEEKKYPFDQIHVEKDLESIEGFNFINYPYDPTGFRSPQIFNVVEWAYSYRANMQDDYALYIYFYNPQALNIDATSNQNKVVMAVEYDNYPITQDSAPTVYETFDLAFCSRSTGDYENLFYKFRVVDHKSADGKTMLERVNSNGRRYDISEIMLKTAGNSNATAYGVGGTFYFTGYAAGYGSDANAPSTLNCEVLDLETVDLEVKSTFFRTQSSQLGKGHQNQLNTVYFGVPDKLLEKYGKLQKIKAEWFEYKTKPVYIINHFEAYEKLKAVIGQPLATDYDENLYFGLGFGKAESGSTSFVRVTYQDAFNVYEYSGVFSAVSVINRFNEINYLFKTEEEGQDLTDYVLAGEDLKQYIEDYGKGGETLPIKDGTISADLFEDHVDEGRTRGKNVKEIDANDKFDMLSYDDTHTFWEKLFEYGFYAPDMTDDTYKAVAPIYAVTTDDLKKNDEELSKALLIDESDVGEFKAYAAAASLKNETTHLFRFGQTDYFSEYGVVTKKDNDFNDSAMRAQQTVFYDFVIISLTFSKDGVYKVIPAVSSPIDIINDVTPPVDETFWIWDAIKDWFGNLFQTLGAWGTLILSIIIGLVILIVEFKIFDLILQAKTTAIKVILFIAFLTLFVWLDYLAVDFVIQTIEGLGGLF